MLPHTVSVEGLGSAKAMMSYSRISMTSSCLEDILESAIGVYIWDPKYTSNVRAEEILVSDWLKFASREWFFQSVENLFGSACTIYSMIQTETETQKH